MFNQAFLDKFDPVAMQHCLRSDGIVCFERALSSQFLSQFKTDVNAAQFGFNHNSVRGVYWGKQYVVNHVLAWSSVAVDFVLSDITEQVTQLLEGHTRIKALRYYETYAGHRMQWHIDNKSPAGVLPTPGLILLFYVGDVNDGELQYVQGSHLDSSTFKRSTFSEAWVNERYAARIRSFKAPAGSLLVYDTRGIHRAKPVMKAPFQRASVLCQIDASTEDAEHMLLNPAYLKPDQLQRTWVQHLLGLGKPAHYHTWPRSSLASMPTKTLLRELAKEGWLKSKLKSAVISCLPDSAIGKLKQLLRRRAK